MILFNVRLVIIHLPFLHFYGRIESLLVIYLLMQYRASISLHITPFLLYMCAFFVRILYIFLSTWYSSNSYICHPLIIALLIRHIFTIHLTVFAMNFLVAFFIPVIAPSNVSSLISAHSCLFVALYYQLSSLRGLMSPLWLPLHALIHSLQVDEMFPHCLFYITWLVLCYRGKPPGNDYVNGSHFIVAYSYIQSLVLVIKKIRRSSWRNDETQFFSIYPSLAEIIVSIW